MDNRNKWNGAELCEKSINIVIDSLVRNKDSFKTIEKRNSIYVYYNDKVMYRHHKSKCLKENENFDDYLPLIAAIRKNIDRFIDRHKDDIELIPDNNNTIIKNQNNYNLLKTECIFQEIDIQEAYFQSMYRLGYISPQLFHKYNHFEQYKNAYIYGITWLQCDEIVKEYKRGKVINEYNKYRPQYKIIYDNIRYFINNLTDEAIRNCTKNGFFKKQVDAIFCNEESTQKICDFFKAKGIEIKITHLIKKDDSQYIKGNEVKKF